MFQRPETSQRCCRPFMHVHGSALQRGTHCNAQHQGSRLQLAVQTSSGGKGCCGCWCMPCLCPDPPGPALTTPLPLPPPPSAKTMLSYPILHRPRFFRIKLRLRSGEGASPARGPGPAGPLELGVMSFCVLARVQ